MKRWLYPILFVAAGTGLVSGVNRGINWSSEFFQTNVLSDGVTTIDSMQLSQPATHTFTFDLGQFDEGFTPTSVNVAEWESRWNSAGTTIYDPVDDNAFRARSELADNTTFAAGSQAYIWGYNNRNLDGDTEWILMEDPSWLFPFVDASTALPDVTFTVASDSPGPESGVALFGAVNGPGFLMMTDHPVPEPNSVLLFAAATGSFLLRRRRRG